ncbi:MAG: NAD-glutamate dehydrogenase [Rickettsiales bacterium]|nr:NAD-glutamate dehydrogenase [Rickettsiales bacterium]
MKVRSAKSIEKKIDNIIKTFPEETKKDENLKKFIQLFFGKIINDDLLSQSSEILFNISNSIYDFLKNYKDKEAKIRVFNSQNNDFDNKNTVIEIISKDMPFIVDSITDAITRKGYAIESVVNRVICVERNKKGKLDFIHLSSHDTPAAQYESVVHFQITRINDKENIKELEDHLAEVLELVASSVGDWQATLNKLNEVRNEIRALDMQLHHDDLSESLTFLDWAEDKAFIFLGYVEYNVEAKGENIHFNAKKNSKLGIFRKYDPDDLKVIKKELFETNDFENAIVEISKAEAKSYIHRPAHLDIIRIKKYSPQGEVTGEYRFFGLFTSVVFYQNASNIPILRKKITQVINRAGFDLSGHNGKELVSVLAAYPREELFQISQDELYETAMGIISLSGRSISKIFVREDKFGRFASVICYIPKKNYSSGIREKIQRLLSQEFNGKITAHYTQITETSLARVHFIIKTGAKVKDKIDHQKIEKEISRIATLWYDRFAKELEKFHGQDKARKLNQSYQGAFSLAYTEHFSAEESVIDTKIIEELILKNNIVIKLFPSDFKEHLFSLKLYSNKEKISLSRMMPILDDFGLQVIEEHTYKICPNLSEDSELEIMLHNFILKIPSLNSRNFNKIREIFEQAVIKCWQNEIENDSLNKLVLSSYISARDISLIRAYCRYLKQINFQYSFEFIAEVLFKNSIIITEYIKLFYAKFHIQNEVNEKLAEEEILQYIAKVVNLAEDTVLRKLYEVIKYSLRTNFFQSKDGEPKSYISFKLASQKISDIPLPKPFAEIFVYSSTMEGVHLRGGKVARGGLRWSDRTEDFRTEVHGLVKAQITKNAVIVPTGSKGGFVVKKDLSSCNREEFMAEGIKAYKIFLSGLLDITDNIVAGKIIYPEHVIRYDEDDPYLVVAADKGTATFSDIANSISKEYNFWLGDAFASGGSQGYDHKKMGITAKGAWVSVKRHFYEMGKNIDKSEFTAIGVGDMSGDVFGNGMLLSDNIKLIAAFNHLHIFLDPNPDSKKSFVERKRLFNLPRSSWSDYSKNQISKGGGVFERSAKIINISKEIQDILNITDKSLTPNQLIKAILKSPVDLFWNGGIGTYVKSSYESDGEIGDHANDDVRINANELNCQIVGEGGNLGFTQKGRIEYALKGGRINTDSIDNSAGVDCSDHEVNIKIAFQSAIEDKRLNLTKRNQLLEKMTKDVEELVLRDNFLQTQAISVALHQGVKSLEQHERMMQKLEKLGILNRDVESLPNYDEVVRRQSLSIGLTRPELSVLLSYSKIYLYDNILNSNLPDDEYYYNELVRYFPEELSKNYAKDLKNHNLRREIIATYVTNSLVNRLGITFFNRLSEDTGLKMCDIARAYTITRDAFKLRDLWASIKNISENINSKIELEMYREIVIFIERTTSWFIRNIEQPITDITKLVKEFSPKLEEVYDNLDNTLTDSIKSIYDDKYQYYLNNKIPAKIAKKVAAMEFLSSSCQIVQISRMSKKTSVLSAAKFYFEIGSRLHFRYLRAEALSLRIDSYWDKLSINSYIDNLFDQQMAISQKITEFSGKFKNKLSESEVFEKWIEKNHKQVKRFDELIYDLQSHDHPNFAMLNVAANRVAEIFK